MDTLKKSELNHFSKILGERKQRLLEEIRRVLARSHNERYADILAGGGDAGDTSIADLLSDVTLAEVARDGAEVRDISAAQARLAAGRYGICIDCGGAIEKKRLEAYPSAKRCLADQQKREKTRASAPHSRF
jgi:RNA polymerase-binding transcription factor DksA